MKTFTLSIFICAILLHAKCEQQEETIMGQNYTGDINGSVDIACEQNLEDEHNIVWYFVQEWGGHKDLLYVDGEAIRTISDFSLVAPKVLRVSGLNSNLSGFYLCILKSYSSLLREYHFVTVERQPSVWVENDQLTVDEESSLWIKCLSYNIHFPPKWEKVTGPLLESGMEQKNESVFLSNVTVDHEGIYLCAAESYTGRKVASVNLKVNFKPRIVFDIKPMKSGTHLTLLCSAYGKPNVTKTQVYKDNSRIIYDNRTVLERKEESFVQITIYNVSLMDQDQFIFRAENKLGNKTAVQELHLRPSHIFLDGNGVENDCNYTFNFEWHVSSIYPLVQQSFMYRARNDTQIWNFIANSSLQGTNHGNLFRFFYSISNLRFNTEYKLQLTITNKFGSTNSDVLEFDVPGNKSCQYTNAIPNENPHKEQKITVTVILLGKFGSNCVMCFTANSKGTAEDIQIKMQ